MGSKADTVVELSGNMFTKPTLQGILSVSIYFKYHSETPSQVGVGHQTTVALLIADYPQGLGVLQGLADVLRLQVHPALVQELFDVLRAVLGLEELPIHRATHLNSKSLPVT